MTVDIFSKSGIEADDLNLKARKAIQAFRALQPTLSAYARILTGKPNIRVEIAARDNGSTDGERIFFRPPIALGDSTPHVRRDCDKRGEDKTLVCPACAIREDVLVTIYHEIAHICYDSFHHTTEADKKHAIEFAIREAKGKWAKQIATRIHTAPPYKTRDYINLASLVNEYLPFLVNCLEDARVNAELFKARKGTKYMFEANTEKIFRDGVEQKDPDGNIVTILWKDYKLNPQVMIGCFCKASGYDYSNWFHPKVIKALDDPQLTEIIDKIHSIYSATGIYYLSFEVLARLRELGFCGTPQDPDPEPEPEEEPEDDEERSPDSDDVSPEPEPRSGDESGDDGDASDSESSESGPREAESGNDESSTETESDSEGQSSGDDSEKRENDSESDESDSSSGDGGETDSTGPSEGDVSESNSDEQDSSADGEQASKSDDDFGEDSSNPSEEGESDINADQDGVSPESGESGDEDADDATPGTGSDAGSPSSGSVPDETASDDESDSAEGSEADPSEVSDSTSGSSGSNPEPNLHEDESESADSERKKDLHEEEDEPIDTGADDGYGGTQVEGEVDDTPDMGTPEDVEEVLHKWGDHEEKPKTISQQDEQDAVDRGIVQGIYFTTPSRKIYTVREHFYGKPIIIGGVNTSMGWGQSYRSLKRVGIEEDFEPPETILQPALLKARIAFSDNRRGREQRNKKSGKVNAKVLGKRAHFKDPRLFQKKIVPGKKDYFVLIGVDISFSTVGQNIMIEKQCVLAQAELLNRLGIPFCIYAHTGYPYDPSNSKLGMAVEIYIVKEPDEIWTTEVKDRFRKIGPVAANLDGHTLEYYRKTIEKVRATDKIILYYTDGKMPAENHNEELTILQREILICKQKNITLLGVGIRTDSPIRHGLDTVQVNDVSEIKKVVSHLEKRLLAK